MDREIFEELKGKNIQIITDEHQVLWGIVEEVFETSFQFLTHGKIRYIDFSRILEVRP